jgi:hypothetical protein
MYPILPGAFCVPSALQALTGADYEAEIMPALNRAQRNPTLLDGVAGVNTRCAEAALNDLGYRVRRAKREVFRGKKLGTIAKLSAQRWPGRALYVTVDGHALAVADGRIYDTHTPHGAPGDEHPYRACPVHFVGLVEKR